jgi:copper homeostasis protein CutC
MSIPFSQFPGRHERHHRRKIASTLFAFEVVGRQDERLLEMQRLDHEELIAFLDELRRTVQRAVDLEPNAGSEIVLALKEDLDRLYEVSAGLADDHSGNQAAIRQLLEVIMRNVERGAAADPQALAQLQQEALAREAHFSLLTSPLVADILHPDSTIAEHELAPTLLSAGEQDLHAALQLFDLAQLVQLYADAERCLMGCAAPPGSAADRLGQIAAQLARLRQEAVVN